MFAASVISLPQIIVQIGGQNSWLVPIVMFPFLVLLIYLIFGKKENHQETFLRIFSIGTGSKIREKILLLFFSLFAVLTFVHDLRALIDFIASYLLPNTPIDMLMVLSVFVILYISMAGIEVIARINAIHFFILLIVLTLLPFLLLNEWELANLQPLPSLKAVKSIILSVYFSLSWMGEMVLFIIIIANINPLKAARKAVITGTALGLFLFFLILFLAIVVLGTKIVREATYPSYILVQQINLTDFLDRLDLVIVAVWLPAFFSKLAYLLFAFNFCLSYFYKSNTNKFLLPVGWILGFLSILLFKNNLEHLHFSFYTWNSLGLCLELVIVLLFLLVRKSLKNKDKVISEEKHG